MNSIFNASNKKTIVISGGSGTIAQAILAKIVDLYPHLLLCVLTRTPEKVRSAHSSDPVEVFQCDLMDMESLSKIFQEIEKKHQCIDGAIHCPGILHSDQLSPEKNLSQIDSDSMMESFKVNTITFINFTRFVRPLLPKSSFSFIAALSAKVGSIEDNRLGGWYSYRASKAALNMCVKNVAIELQHYRLPGSCIAIHPGTTQSELSNPFTKNIQKDKLYSPDQSATRILDILSVLKEKSNGSFLNWDGSSLPW